jgi:hypothetical protein
VTPEIEVASSMRVWHGRHEKDVHGGKVATLERLDVGAQRGQLVKLEVPQEGSLETGGGVAFGFTVVV